MPIAPSTYYAHQACPVSAAALEEAYLVNSLVTLHLDNWGVYGARKLWHAARRAGLEVSRDQVARLMRVGGIHGVVRGRHTTRTTWRDQQAARHPDLVQRAWDAPTRLDELWVADFSYVWTLTGFVYVAFILDVFSRRILGWRVSGSKQTPLVTDALHQALTTRRIAESRWTATGLVHHSDAGSQGGFNRSSQHPVITEVFSGSSTAGSRQGDQAEVEVAGSSEVPASCRGGVLGRNRQGAVADRGGHSRRGVTAGRATVVPQRWRHAAVRREVPALGTLSLVH
jgi:hypothetical protein